MPGARHADVCRQMRTTRVFARLLDAPALRQRASALDAYAAIIIIGAAPPVFNGAKRTPPPRHAHFRDISQMP